MHTRNEKEMLRSCQYCGRIHDAAYLCPQKAKRIKARQSYKKASGKKIQAFRRSEKWKKKSIEIRTRDKYCCQICRRNLYEAERQYETEGISVHHIMPLAKNWDMRLNNDNLISLCQRHHEMAEKGKIPKEELRAIARQQEEEDEIIFG